MTISSSERQYYIERILSQLVQIHASVLTSEVNLNTRFDILEAKMALNFDSLNEKVEKTHGVVNSLIALVQGYADEVRTTAGDQQRANDLADRMEADIGAATAAIAANPLPGETVNPAPEPAPQA